MQIATIIIAAAMLIIGFAAIRKDYPAAGEMKDEKPAEQ